MKSEISVKGWRGRHFAARDDDHTPSNFRVGERRAVAELYLRDYDGKSASNPNPWLNVELIEHITSPGGRVTQKTISFVLDAKGRDDLIRYLNGAEE